jgi:hypothetical protein
MNGKRAKKIRRSVAKDYAELSTMTNLPFKLNTFRQSYRKAKKAYMKGESYGIRSV